MHEGQTKYQEQQNPIQGATDGDAKEDDAATDVHRISRPCENAGGREHQSRLRWVNVRADVPKIATGPDHHSKAHNERNSADHYSYQEGNMIEQIQRRSKVQDNPHY